MKWMWIRKISCKIIMQRSSWWFFLCFSSSGKSYAIKLFIRNSPYIHKKAKNMKWKINFPSLALSELFHSKKTFPICEKHVACTSKGEILFLFVLSSPFGGRGCRGNVFVVTLFTETAVNWTIKLSQIQFMYESRSDLPRENSLFLSLSLTFPPHRKWRI